MPKKEMDFSRTVIYKIICKDLAIKDLYVGSTTDLVKRRYQHKYDSTNEKSAHRGLTVYKCIKDNGGWGNWEAILVEEYPCKSDEQRRARERHWMEELNANLNSNRPFVTREEKRETSCNWNKKNYAENAEVRQSSSEYNKSYNAAHKVEFQTKRSEKAKCECGAEICRGAIWRHTHSKRHTEAMSKFTQLEPLH
jgi:hypothetical protein